MASVKIIHYTHKVNTDGTSPIIIQVIDRGKVKRKSFGNIFKEQWDVNKQRVIPKKHDNYAQININISNDYNRIEKSILDGSFDFERVFDENNRNGSNAAITFKELSDLYIKSLKSGWSKIGYGGTIRRFLQVVHVGNLRMKDIKAYHLERYKQSMAGKELSTQRSNLKVIRFVNTYAKKTKICEFSQEVSEYELPKEKKSRKVKLTADEFEKLKSLEVAGKNAEKKRQVLDLFLLAIYLRGIRIGDMLTVKEADFINGRFIYTSNKNQKHFNIKLVPDAKVIVERNTTGSKYLFPFYKYIWDGNKSQEENIIANAEHIKTATVIVNKYLKLIAKDAGISKTISTHIARHTFARMALSVIKDTSVSMDLVGHSNLKEHEAYVKEIMSDDELDAAADDIFG